jgi:hypothetical protein
MVATAAITGWLVFCLGAGARGAAPLEEPVAQAEFLRGAISHRQHMVRSVWGHFFHYYYANTDRFDPKQTVIVPPFLELIFCWSNTCGWRYDLRRVFPDVYDPAFGKQGVVTVTFDGSMFRRVTGGGRCVESARHEACVLAQYLDAGPWSEKDGWSADMLRDGFTVRGMEQRGHLDCWHLETKRDGSLWHFFVAPARGYAVVEAYTENMTPEYKAGGPGALLRSQVFWEGFRQLSPGVWWPGRRRFVRRSVRRGEDKRWRGENEGWCDVEGVDTIEAHVNEDDSVVPFQYPAPVGTDVAGRDHKLTQLGAQGFMERAASFSDRPEPELVTDQRREP